MKKSIIMERVRAASMKFFDPLVLDVELCD